MKAQRIGVMKTRVKAYTYMKNLAVVVLLPLVSLICMGMRFSPPERIGQVDDHGIVGGGYIIHGSVCNTGTMYDKKEKYYKNGVASFGKGDDLIYFHYNDKNYFDKNSIRSYGGKNFNNTFRLTQAYGCEFFQIKTDSDLTLYMIREYQFDIRGEKYSLLGRKKDGTFVKYFDTWNISERYFGSKYPKGYCYGKWWCNGDTITIEFVRDGQISKKVGAFRFKWDNQAKWFGVEQIAY